MSKFLEDIEFSFKGSQLFYEDKMVECKNDIIDICLGQYGDGCGGGRVFILFDTEIKVYDCESQAFMQLSLVFKNAKSIDKKACDLFISLKDEEIVFNLSTMEKRTLTLRETS